MNKFSSVGVSEFDRGSIFVNIENDHDKHGNLYMLVRESRPDQCRGEYCYNLLNLETGKMRFTESDRTFWTSEPITMEELTSRFGIMLYHVGHISDTVPLIREWAAGKIEEDRFDPRAAALSALVGADGDDF